MIVQRKVQNSSENFSNDEVARLLQEIEKMKVISQVNDERTRLMSEEMSEKINQLNVQVESVRNSGNNLAPETSYCNARKYPQIQIIDDSDDNSISVVKIFKKFFKYFFPRIFTFQV